MRVTNAVDRHVENGRGRIRWRLSTTSRDHRTQTRLTFADLQTRVAACRPVCYKRMAAWAKGDRVIIYNANGPPKRLRQCWPVRAIGAVHSVVFRAAFGERAGRGGSTTCPSIIARPAGWKPSRVVA